MKKKFLCLALMICLLFGLTACGKSKFNLLDHLIEERNNLFTAEDETYCVTFSSGRRETNYNLDGVKNEMVDFGVLTLARLDRNPLAVDTYNYIITINGQEFSGQLTSSEYDNTYSVDIGANASNDATVSVKINFTGNSFEKQLTATSNNFAVDMNGAVKIANDELKSELKNLTANKNSVEAVVKIVKDYSSSEVQSYYWYIGVVSTNGDTLGILIDASNGSVIAKKA